MHRTAMQLIETRTTAFFQEIPRQRQCYLPALLSGENPGVLLESPSTEMDVFSSLVKFYYKKCFSYIYWYMYLYLSLYMSSCKSKNVEKELFTSDPLACLSIVQYRIKHQTPLQSSKFKAS